VNGPDPFEDLAAAATQGPAAFAARINWPVSGVALLVRSAALLDDTERADVVGRGVSELLAGGRPGADPLLLLGTLAAYLEEGPALAAPRPDQDARIRAELCPGPLPGSIAEADRHTLQRLADQACSVTRTAVLRLGGHRDVGLAVGAYERVALIRLQRVPVPAS